MAGDEKSPEKNRLQREAKLAQALRENLRRRKAGDRTAPVKPGLREDDRS